MPLDEDQIKKIQHKKILSYLKPLLLDINENESNYNNSISDILQHRFNFKKSFILFSESQIYQHASIIGLTKSFTRNTKYLTVNINLLLDIWYQSRYIIIY